MNSFPTQHDRVRYIEAQAAYARELALHCDYALTLQTKLPTFGIRASTMQHRQLQVQSAINVFRKRLNQVLTGHAWRRKNSRLPVFIASIEGSVNTHQLNKTLHVHAALGNAGHVATEQTRQYVEDACRQLWAATDVGTADVVVKLMQQGTEQRWLGYTVKEAENMGNWEVLNWQTAQAPGYIIEGISGKL